MHPDLPKAKLFYCKYRHWPHPHWLGRWRLANSMFIWIGPVEIGWRMPWLERSARALYPHLFEEATDDR